MTTIYDLPKPKDSALAQSKALTRCIQQEITANGGLISFATFMELSLYHPTFGYYNAESFSLGEKGDFTTAPEISPLFSYCFAKQIQQLFSHLDTKNILELGAGTGQFAVDLIPALNQLNSLPEHYYIYEISVGLRKKQQDYLRASCPDYFSRIIWLDRLPDQFIGCVIANEVLDALPTNCFSIQNNEVLERCVKWENNTFTWEYHSPITPHLREKVAEIRDLYHLRNGYESEINLHAQSFIQALAASIHQGVILFADYGYGQREYYHPERNHGTLTCFYQHQRHNNPLILPGLQDITAHVDFTNIIENAADSGCQLEGYTSQAAFLLACGLMDFAAEQEKDLSPANEVKLHHAIKLLTLPTEMGERIKVMCLSKGMNKKEELSLIGFGFHDRRRDL